MLTDVGEQYNHDLIHMVIFYMIQTLSRAAQNNYTMKHSFKYIIYFKNRKQYLWMNLMP